MQRKVTVSEKAEAMSYTTGMSAGSGRRSFSSRSYSRPTNTSSGAYGSRISRLVNRGYSVKNGSGGYKYFDVL